MCAMSLMTAGSVSIAGAILWGVLLTACRFICSICSVSIAGAILWGVLLRYTNQYISDLVVSIAGAILWGVLPHSFPPTNADRWFQSQGRFFGGCCGPGSARHPQRLAVSIAGAILWGVLPVSDGRYVGQCNSFNRRGDSLGGAARPIPSSFMVIWMFQSQGRFFGGCCFERGTYIPVISKVSIAGAILWGVLPHRIPLQRLSLAVSIAGAILWGVLRRGNGRCRPHRRGFNRRGDSLGGAAIIYPS